MAEQSFCIFTNPEPWRVPPMSPGRGKNGHLIVKSGRDQMLSSYQEEVREALLAQGAYMMDPGYKIELYFYRIQETVNTGSGKRNMRNRADATNMQKAFEDALQGTVIHNDVDTVSIASRIIPAGTMGDEPFVFARVIGEYEFKLDQDMPAGFGPRTIESLKRELDQSAEDDNTWTV